MNDFTNQLSETCCGRGFVERQNDTLEHATRRQNDALERATRQLDSIEQLITLLMDDIDFSELKMSEKLNFALKLMAQHARTLKLHEDIGGEHEHNSGEQEFIDRVSRKLRGDPSDQDFDDPLSVEVEF